jgi:hypothetical protein
MSENLPDAESVAAKTGVDPEVVKVVLEAAAAETTTTRSEASGSSHKIEIPTAVAVPSATITE